MPRSECSLEPNSLCIFLDAAGDLGLMIPEGAVPVWSQNDFSRVALPPIVPDIHVALVAGWFISFIQSASGVLGTVDTNGREILLTHA